MIDTPARVSAMRLPATASAAALLLLLAIAAAAPACGRDGNPAAATGEAGLPANDAQPPGADGAVAPPDGGSIPHDATVPPPPPGDSGGTEGGQDATPPPKEAGPAPFDVTFYVMADSHADPVPEDDLLAQVRAINQVGHGGAWPAQIDGASTGFLGGPIAPARGVVIAGDLTGWGTAPTEIPVFRSYFEKGNSSSSIDYPAYVGVGNHDIDTADRDDVTAAAYRATYWQYIDSRYSGPSAPVPVTSFDPASHSYSWDFDGVHLVMTHRYAGDTEYGRPSDLAFLAADLQKHAGDGRPVFLFHHYGMDAFGTNGQWWTSVERDAYRALLTGYHVAGDFTGHSHYAMQYSWEGLRVFQVNNAKAEIDSGNEDGNGSFAVVRVTNQQLDIVTCRWTDDQGHYELIAPYFSGPSDVGPVPPTP